MKEHFEEQLAGTSTRPALFVSGTPSKAAGHLPGTPQIHIGQLVEQELRAQRRSVQWLSEQLYCNRSNAYRLLQRPTIDTGLLMRLSRILGRNFFEEYSTEMQRHFRSNRP